MSSLVVIGAQWGDEGKGKITDFLTEKADMVVRYQGGDNAGHTVMFDDKTFKLHLIPSGIFYKENPAVIGNGVVVNPKALLKEMDYLKEKGISTDNLKISDRAHIIMPYHIALDEIKEKKRGDKQIGTTKKGIGPCYMDKYERSGIRFAEALHKDTFILKMKENIKAKNELFVKYYNAEPLDEKQIIDEYLEYIEILKPYICDTVELVQSYIRDNKKVLFEGAQGTLLDIDYGTYPYLTSSHPTSGGVAVGAGISSFQLKGALGVVKAYTTRVGKGPFPTELDDEVGEFLRERGHEFGTTTGRARRCGWLDLVMMRYSVNINGFNTLALTKLDTLADLEEIKVCVAYENNGVETNVFPASLEDLAEYRPVYKSLKGFKKEEIDGVKEYDKLPKAAKDYILFIEDKLGVPIDLVSVGPGRLETILRKDIF